MGKSWAHAYLARGSHRKMDRIRNLFTRGLRGMPRSYITRVVFDSSHKTLCLVRDSQVCSLYDLIYVYSWMLCPQVVAGISFRLFASEKLIEIVFVAVDAREQVKVQTHVCPS